MSDIINKWNVLQNLSKDFVSNINSVYIYGTNGKQVIITTNDDNVYAFGDSDSDGCLGLGHTNAVQEPTIIEELCGQQVKQIEFGIQYNFAFAFTINGNIYSWGCNRNGELGIGNTITQYKPTIINVLSDKNVIDIKSGVCHSLALTTCGDVYIWGYRMGNSPIKMRFVATNQKIVSISSGVEHALALSNKGRVFYWGNNEYGQCGNGNNTNDSNVAEWCESQNTTDMYVKKIVCGLYHSLVLSTNGNVYCFGRNHFGQCGDGTNVDKNNPTMVNINAKFIDIAAAKHNHMSVGLSDNRLCYVWGKDGQISYNNPIETIFDDMNELLEHYSFTKVTFKPLIFKSSRISEKFNKREHSDIAFKVKDKYIYAQKSHLINACKYFETMFSDNNWIESKSSEIEINDYSYDVYYAFIKYLYTDCVDICGDKTIELIDLANYYLEEPLKQRCVKLIKNLINNENVFAIYCSAIKYDSNLLRAYCIEFINFADKTNIRVIMDNAVKLIEK